MAVPESPVASYSPHPVRGGGSPPGEPVNLGPGHLEATGLDVEIPGDEFEDEEVTEEIECHGLFPQLTE